MPAASPLVRAPELRLNVRVNSERGLVVVVEDERAIAELERLYLSQAGFGVHVAADGTTGLADVLRLAPVAVVVDLALPGMDGTELVRRLRAADNWVPVIMVTAQDGEIDRVLGIELGADDYLTKPFSPRELVARVKALVRRAAIAPAAARQVGALQLDRQRHTASNDGRAIDLTATEFGLLAYLVDRPGQVFSREQLLAAVWGVADYRGSRTVDVHVAQLRAKLGEPDPIRTVRGVGYALRDEG